MANPYPVGFFPRWWWHIITIYDYPYVGIDFRGYLDMPLPLGAAYGDIGNESQTQFLIFLNYYIFVFFDILTQKTCFGVTTHSDNLSCVCRCRTMAAKSLPSSSTEGKRRRFHGHRCRVDAPKHPHKLCTLDTQGTHGTSRGLA